MTLFLWKINRYPSEVSGLLITFCWSKPTCPESVPAMVALISLVSVETGIKMPQCVSTLRTYSIVILLIFVIAEQCREKDEAKNNNTLNTGQRDESSLLNGVDCHNCDCKDKGDKPTNMYRFHLFLL